MSTMIAVIDDEPDILELLAVQLGKAGFRTKEFAEADRFLRSLSTDVPDLILLDLMLPDTDGFEICKFLKNHEKYSSIPIIMLTARSEETDKVLGLELGADDYVTKPFSPRELVARVKAVLRRREKREDDKRVLLGTIGVIDFERFEVEIEGRKIDLTLTEFKILQLLATRKGHIYSRQQILDYLWGQDKLVLDRTVDVHIRHLREKLGRAAGFVKSIRGVGYRLEE
jgi:DNA-binding response OmpR family regulator